MGDQRDTILFTHHMFIFGGHFFVLSSRYTSKEPEISAPGQPQPARVTVRSVPPPGTVPSWGDNASVSALSHTLTSHRGNPGLTPDQVSPSLLTFSLKSS